jgi:hypothetical protein
MSKLPDITDAARVRVHKTRILAAISSLAAEHFFRILAVGGPIFAAHGLISPRLSRSAAVIVDPASFGDFVATLMRSGWTISPPVRHFAVLPSALLVMEHQNWVVRLHLYAVIPGFYIDPKRAFAILWARRQLLPLHETTVLMVDRLSMIIMAVHNRLGPQSWTANEQEYDRYLIEQFRAALNSSERKELLELVCSFGAIEPMRSLLDALELDPGDAVLPTESYTRWRLSIPSATTATIMALAFVECPPRRRLRRCFQVLRRSPAAAARASLGFPKAWWLIFTAKRRKTAQYREFVIQGE